MLRLFFFVGVLGLSTACVEPTFTALEPDNPDALEEIPEAPETVPRDDATESPYDPPAADPTSEHDEPEIVDEPEEPEEPEIVDEPEEPEEPEVIEPEEPEEPEIVEPEEPELPEEPDVDEPEEPACPVGVTCVDDLPATYSGNTTGSPSLWDSYACSPGTDESGPEDLYEIVLPTDGFLAVTLSGVPSGVDVDVHLLSDVDSNACIDRGHWEAASLLPAGTYYVAIDSWVDSSGVVYDGAYTVRFQHTPYDAYASTGLSPLVMQRSLTAFDTAWHAGDTSRLIYTVADFDLPSTQRRLWTFDLATGTLLFNEHVAHGSNSSDPSNPSMVAVMSNTNGSHQSSVGLMRTAETYQGSNGYSMRLDGLESGFNNAVRGRAIVFHKATYATASFAAANGYLGRSWGCPAVDPAINAALIDTIKNGTLYMSHFSGDTSWLTTSSYL